MAMFAVSTAISLAPLITRCYTSWHGGSVAQLACTEFGRMTANESLLGRSLSFLPTVVGLLPGSGMASVFSRGVLGFSLMDVVALGLVCLLVRQMGPVVDYIRAAFAQNRAAAPLLQQDDVEWVEVSRDELPASNPSPNRANHLASPSLPSTSPGKLGDSTRPDWANRSTSSSLPPTSLSVLEECGNGVVDGVNRVVAHGLGVVGTLAEGAEVMTGYGLQAIGSLQRMTAVVVSELTKDLDEEDARLSLSEPAIYSVSDGLRDSPAKAESSLQPRGKPGNPFETVEQGVDESSFNGLQSLLDMGFAVTPSAAEPKETLASPKSSKKEASCVADLFGDDDDNDPQAQYSSYVPFY